MRINVPESHKRYIKGGSITKPCGYCQKPITQARGQIIELLDRDNNDPDAKVIARIQTSDQRVFFHKGCRKAGRRALRKQEKLQKKLNK